MAFTWTPISKNQRILADHINEIKNNLDTLFHWEGVTWNWSNLPVSSGGHFTVDAIQELRNATDYADAHKCKTDYAGHDSGVHSGYNAGDNNGYNSSEDTGHNYTVHSNEYAHEHATDNGTYDSGQNSTVTSKCSADNSPHVGCNAHDGTVRSTENTGDYSGYSCPSNQGPGPTPA